MALDATVAGPNANSFATLQEANDYFAERLYSSLWVAATEAEKTAALIMATGLLVSDICWTGAPTTTTQSLPWPRTGMVDRNGNDIADDVIPQPVKASEFEMALALLKGDRTTESDIEALGLTKLKAGPVELGFSGDAKASVVPAFVISLLPSTWLCPVDDPNVKTLVFEAL